MITKINLVAPFLILLGAVFSASANTYVIGAQPVFAAGVFAQMGAPLSPFFGCLPPPPALLQPLLKSPLLKSKEVNLRIFLLKSRNIAQNPPLINPAKHQKNPLPQPDPDQR